MLKCWTQAFFPIKSRGIPKRKETPWKTVGLIFHIFYLTFFLLLFLNEVEKKSILPPRIWFSTRKPSTKAEPEKRRRRKRPPKREENEEENEEGRSRDIFSSFLLRLFPLLLLLSFPLCKNRRAAIFPLLIRKKRWVKSQISLTCPAGWWPTTNTVLLVTNQFSLCWNW